MSRATDLLDTYPSIYPWWVSLKPAHRGHVTAVTTDPDDDTADQIEHHITAHAVHAAYRELQRLGALCCGETMRTGDYTNACSNDADLILQRAAFGQVVYG